MLYRHPCNSGLGRSWRNRQGVETIYHRNTQSPVGSNKAGYNVTTEKKIVGHPRFNDYNAVYYDPQVARKTTQDYRNKTSQCRQEYPAIKAAQCAHTLHQSNITRNCVTRRRTAGNKKKIVPTRHGVEQYWA